MFYCYDQNNSGGRWDIDERLSPMLFIEADSAEQANETAESLGCYFDGVEQGIDCPCCGDRWVRNYDSPCLDETDNRSIEEEAQDLVDRLCVFYALGKDDSYPEGRIYYADGRVNDVRISESVLADYIKR